MQRGCGAGRHFRGNGLSITLPGYELFRDEEVFVKRAAFPEMDVGAILRPLGGMERPSRQ